MDSQVFVRVSRLSHIYPRTRRSPRRIALSEITFDVLRGESVALLGPNGSGKSTLLGVLTSSLQPSSGSVSVDGADLLGKPSAVRPILGVVFQKPALDGKMTVAENLRGSGLMYGISRRELSQQIPAMLREVGLAERASERVDSLSGGLARRVELAKALLTRPRLLILDEPTVGLDPSARQDFWRTIEATKASRELTVIVSTHQLDEASRCDRVGILHGGKLLALDRPDRLQEQVGREVLTIWGEDVASLQEEVQERLKIEGQIIDGALCLPLNEARVVSVDSLMEQFHDRISRISISHPSLDDVFVHYTGRHLNAAGEEGL